jgi:hypothetical protein
MLQGCRLPVFEEAEERLDSRQPDIACHRRVFTFVLEVLQEGADKAGIELLQHQRVRLWRHRAFRGERRGDRGGGATDVINASNVDPVEAIKEMTGGGVEYSFEAVGLETTAEQSFQCLRPGGTATIIGMVPFGMKIELHGYDFLRERKIQGSSMGSNRFRFDMPKLLNAWKKGELKLDHLISSHIKLEDINEGYVKLKGGEVLRQLIDFGVAK